MTRATVTFQEPNGTYAFTVGFVSGYAASPSAGSIRVAGSPVSEPITFASSSGGGGPSSSFLGLAGNTGYYVVAVVVAAVVLGVAVALILRARHR